MFANFYMQKHTGGSEPAKSKEKERRKDSGSGEVALLSLETKKWGKHMKGTEEVG